ncbi:MULTISPECIES: hypothetical protein [Reichenbachiella]|uniref:Uncharacterized protein n=1 Tax=Reichenbachiella agariperforans TaxID=156994 RepID=A0A1M6K1G6_REIAG|nr:MULTISPECIES: hypothetical protein [Reichenbachiella]MBU2913382.1 hypothetical protein [Reichenbachiella agariperforans]SHJ52682.1 hypothetical protein SAMN04488028_101406 [Reichenbachiella agariperforans]
MNQSYLNYYKLILDRVSFSQELFDKEYRKAMKSLDTEGQRELNEWVVDYLFKSALLSA